MTALKHASLVGQDLAGLTAKSVLRGRQSGQLYTVAKSHGYWLDLSRIPDGMHLAKVAIDRLEYLGELQDDGFITCPEGGWTGNPYAGGRIDVRFRDVWGVPKACEGHNVRLDSDASWIRRGQPEDVIAFRPTPAGDLGALQPQGASVSTEKTDGPVAPTCCCPEPGARRTKLCRKCNPCTAALVDLAKTPSDNPAGEVERLRAALAVIARKTSVTFGRGTMSGEEAASIAAAALEASQ